MADRADERGEQSALAGDAIDLDAVGVNEDEYLAAAGLDPSAIGAAGETTEGTAPTPREVVLTIVEELEDPTRKTILTRADERGIERERARRVLDGLVREGAVVTSADGYRRV